MVDHFDFRLFHFIYLIVNIFQGLQVSSPEIFATGNLGYFLKRSFIDIYFLIDVALAENRVDQKRCLAFGAHTNGVDFYPEGFGGLGGLKGGQGPGIVPAIGQQNDDFGF